MKKTIIALLALSGIALGGTGVTISSHDGNPYITASATHSLTLTATLTKDDLKTIITGVGTNTALLSITSGTATKSVAVASFSSNQSLRIYDAVSAGTTISGAGTTFTWVDALGLAVENPNLNAYFESENMVKGALTLAYNTPHTIGVTEDTQGLYVAFSVAYEDGSVKTLLGYNSAVVTGAKLHVQSVAYDSDYLSIPQIEINTDSTSAIVTRESVLHSNLQAIPEPTTATLSLLALAGLAARRRRR